MRRSCITRYFSMVPLGLLVSVLLLTLIGCSVSDEEKESIAIITCNIIKDSNDMTPAQRLREVNSARDKMGEKPFWGRNADIHASIRYGLCEELVLDDPLYQTKLYEQSEKLRVQQNLEQQKREEARALMERIEKERIEKERIEKERRLEEERIERERIEKERIEKERRLEGERIERERIEKERIEKERVQAKEKFRSAILLHLTNIGFSPSITSLGFNSRSETIFLAANVSPFSFENDFRFLPEIIFKNGLGSVYGKSCIPQHASSLSLTSEVIDMLLNGQDLLDLVEEVNLKLVDVCSYYHRITGSAFIKRKFDPRKFGLFIRDPRQVPNLEDNPIIFNLDLTELKSKNK
jgi:hypothetical protein